MKYRIWYNTRAPNPAQTWVVQGTNEPNYILAPSVVCHVPTTFVTAIEQTPSGWAEAVGSLSVDGVTNAIVIR